jgi:protein deglycase
MTVLVPLVTGFEEIEAISIIDILRRANISVVTAALGNIQVEGAHNIIVTADTKIDELNPSQFNAIVLPGGPGTSNMKKNQYVIKFIQEIYNNGGYAAAICAAPTVLAAAGVLENKKVTCFPGMEGDLNGAIHVPVPFIVDDRIITGQAAGSAVGFSLKLVEIFKSKNDSNDLSSRLHVYWEEQNL